MNLAEVIHQRWAAASGLNDLLPASRVHTGIGVDPTLPYAVLSKQSDRPTQRHNDGSAVSAVELRIRVFHDNYDSAAAVVEQVEAAFNGADFALSGNDRVINMRRSNDFQRQEDDGVWQFVIDFDCTVYLA